MPKFMGIDLLDSLERIMEKNTQSYQGDFAYDRKDLEEAARKWMHSLLESGRIFGCPAAAVPGA